MTADRGNETPPPRHDADAGAENHADSAFAGRAERILRRSEPLVVGRHEWRIVLYTLRTAPGAPPAPLIGYEWRRVDRRDHCFSCLGGGYVLPGAMWRRDEEWPRYDPDDGGTAGLPNGVFRLWERNAWARPRECVRAGDGWVLPGDREPSLDLKP